MHQMQRHIQTGPLGTGHNANLGALSCKGLIKQLGLIKGRKVTDSLKHVFVETGLVPHIHVFNKLGALQFPAHLIFNNHICVNYVNKMFVDNKQLYTHSTKKKEKTKINRSMGPELIGDDLSPSSGGGYWVDVGMGMV